MNNRVLLVFDEFSESEKWHHLLQKMGFSVESIRNEVALITQLLSLRPDAVFIMGQGLLLNPIRVLERLKSQSWFRGKVVILESPLRPINPTELQGYRFDGLLTVAEFSDLERLEIVSHTLELDFDSLYQKYLSTFGSDAESLSKLTSSLDSPYSETTLFPKRTLSDYKKLKKNSQETHLRTGLDRVKLDSKLKATSEVGQDLEDSSIIDKKREFVRALFKKA